MKFWELVSSFGKENVISVLQESKWERFRVSLENYHEIVSQQNRDILDEIIPLELAKKVCGKSKLKFYLYYGNGRNILRSWKMETDEKMEQLSPLDILLRYGGEYIEETIEKGSTIVISKEKR